MPDCLTARVAGPRPPPTQAQTHVRQRSESHATLWAHADPACANVGERALCAVDRGIEGSDRTAMDEGAGAGGGGGWGRELRPRRRLKERRNEKGARENE